MGKLLVALGAVLAASSAGAVVPVYGSPGTPNNGVPFSYTNFTASSTGTIEAYFLGRNAGYTSVLSMKVNGVLVAGPVFDNQSTPNGTKAVLANVNAGDQLEFLLTILKPPAVANTVFSSTPANNADLNNHIFRTAYAGGDFGVPAGTYTYIGFEDILGDKDAVQKNDWDYDDHRFAFTNIRSFTGAIPEPATWAMLIAGFGLVGLSLRRQRQAQA